MQKHAFLLLPLHLCQTLNIKFWILFEIITFRGYHHYFFKIIRILVSSLCNSSRADSDFRWTPWLLAGTWALCPKLLQPNSMAASCCSWSRTRRMSGATPAPTDHLWSILKRQSCCRQRQGTAPWALCSTCQKHCGSNGSSWAQLQEEHF